MSNVPLALGVKAQLTFPNEQEGALQPLSESHSWALASSCT